MRFSHELDEASLRYFALSPEVAGGLGPATVIDTTTHPPTVSRLNYEFAGWLGDDLVETFPCYLVTERLARRLAEANFDGVLFADVEVTVDPQGEELLTDDGPPKVLWLKVSGVAGQDDLGLTAQAQLVVSDRALRELQGFNLSYCDIAVFDP